MNDNEVDIYKWKKVLGSTSNSDGNVNNNSISRSMKLNNLIFISNVYPSKSAVLTSFLSTQFRNGADDGRGLSIETNEKNWKMAAFIRIRISASSDHFQQIGANSCWDLCEYSRISSFDLVYICSN